jgi:hypothetical protein
MVAIGNIQHPAQNDVFFVDDTPFGGADLHATTSAHVGSNPLKNMQLYSRCAFCHTAASIRKLLLMH